MCFGVGWRWIVDSWVAENKIKYFNLTQTCCHLVKWHLFSTHCQTGFPEKALIWTVFFFFLRYRVCSKWSRSTYLSTSYFLLWLLWYAMTWMIFTDCLTCFLMPVNQWAKQTGAQPQGGDRTTPWAQNDCSQLTSAPRGSQHPAHWPQHPNTLFLTLPNRLSSNWKHTTVPCAKRALFKHDLFCSYFICLLHLLLIASLAQVSHCSCGLWVISFSSPLHKQR